MVDRVCCLSCGAESYADKLHCLKCYAALVVERDGLRGALIDARAAIQSLPIAGLGVGTAGGRGICWPLRDELLRNIAAALKAEKEER